MTRDTRPDHWSEVAQALALGDEGDAFGPVPRPTRIPRWFALAGPPEDPSFTRPRATCRRASSPLTTDGRPDEIAWRDAEWSSAFVTIETGEPVALRTHVALLWDATALHAAFVLEDPDPAAIATEHHEWVFLADPDAELFVAGDESYFECGINPLGTVYQIRWSWLEPLVARGDHAAIGRLLEIPDGLYLRPRPGERSGRLGDLGWELPGARYAAAVGEVRLPTGEKVHGWSAEIALPWAGLAPIAGIEGSPAPGTRLRVQAYRAHHDASDPARNAAMEELWGPGATPFVGWTWSPQGNANVHNPERWLEVTLEG